MEKSQPAGEDRLLTHLLLDRHDMAARIALACLHGSPMPDVQAAGVPTADETPQPLTELRKVELEVIRWVAAGKSYPDIAIIMDMPYGTVRYHLERARRRNGFDTMTPLIVRAACDYNLSPLAG